MVRAGELRHQLTIEQRSSTQDAAGEQLNTWSTFATPRAAVVRTPGREIFASAQRAGRVPVVFKLRYLAGVTPAMRIRFNDKVHNILSVTDPDGLKVELVIVADEWTEATA